MFVELTRIFYSRVTLMDGMSQVYNSTQFFFVCVAFLLFALNCRWSDPDNKSVTTKVVSEVKAQFPHFAEGDIKGSVYKCLISLASCKRYFQTLNQREKERTS